MTREGLEAQLPDMQAQLRALVHSSIHPTLWNRLTGQLKIEMVNASEDVYALANPVGDSIAKELNMLSEEKPLFRFAFSTSIGIALALELSQMTSLRHRDNSRREVNGLMNKARDAAHSLAEEEAQAYATIHQLSLPLVQNWFDQMVNAGFNIASLFTSNLSEPLTSGMIFKLADKLFEARSAAGIPSEPPTS